jgi:hypothetical protein
MILISALRAFIRRVRSIEQRCVNMQEALGRIEGRQICEMPVAKIQEAEFKVFSQWGEDGILQYLLRHVPVSRKIFVEFGVENYLESNTRYLLVNNNWAGLVIDGSSANIDFIKVDDIYWRHNLKAEVAFITKDNINDLIRRNGIQGEIGLLSIDIDGNDYWVWEAIDVITPSMVVVEYNSRFGPDKAVVVPYDPGFIRTVAHYSNLYYGGSLAAFCRLAKRKGYSFVGSNSAGSNAFFVKSDLRPPGLPEIEPAEGFISAQLREGRNAHGALTFLAKDQEIAILEKLPMVEIF